VQPSSLLVLPLVFLLIGAAPPLEELAIAAEGAAAPETAPQEDDDFPELPQGLDRDTPVHLSADRLVRDEEGMIEAEGNVRVSAGPMFLAAERVHYDPEAQTARLFGPVTFIDGPFVARASGAFVDLAAQSGTLDEVALFQKEEPPEIEEILETADVIELRRVGRNQLEVHAKRVVRGSDGTYLASESSVTTCDCGEGTPDWRIGASTANLSPDDRLRLSWPVVYAKGIPVLASPYLSLPLTNERKSGLLFAVPHLAGRRGPSYEQPLYLVLGHSYDMTVSAGYYFGHTRTVRAEEGQADAGEVIKEDAFRGPRGSLEFRYTPRIGTGGRFFASYGYDLSKRGDSHGATPHRYGIQLDHSDVWDGGLADRVALNLVSDRNYVRDFVDDIVLRGEQTLRSTAWVGLRSGSAVALAEGVYQQDLRPAFGRGVQVPPDFHEPLRLFGSGVRDTFQRAPAFAFDLARYPGPLGSGLSLHLGAVRFAPWTLAGFGDWGEDGLGPGDFGYPGPDRGEGDGRFERGVLQDPALPGERPSLNRLSIRPTLSLPILFGDWLSLTPFGGWRQAIYDYDQGQGSGVAGWAVVGAAAQTELARTYSTGLRHSWTPRVEARSLLPAHERDAPARIYDELDERPLRTSGQGRASLGSHLLKAVRGGGVLSLDATVGQDVLLGPEVSLAESFANARLSLWPFELSGLLQWDPHRETVTEALAQGRVSSRRGDQLRASYRRLAPGASSRLRAGPDELFADAYFTEESPLFVFQDLDQIGAGATLFVLDGLSLSYDFLFLPDLSSARLLQQQASVGYRSPCECWSGALHFAKRRMEGLDFWISFNLGRF